MCVFAVSVGVYWGLVESESGLLIRRSLVRAQVEEPRAQIEEPWAQVEGPSSQAGLTQLPCLCPVHCYGLFAFCIGHTGKGSSADVRC